MLDALGRVALTALVVACGAEGHEVRPVKDLLVDADMPDDDAQMVEQVKDAIERVRRG